MQTSTQTSHASILRFATVGIINTAIDILLFVSLRSAGTPIVLANICSTSVALIASLILNNKYVFQGRNLTWRIAVQYFAITLVGLWILQPIIITGVSRVNDHIGYIEALFSDNGHTELLQTIIPKLVAIAVTTIWNYVWYSRVIFAQKHAA